MKFCAYCGKEIIGGRAWRKYCDNRCSEARRAPYYRQYHIDHKEERLEKCRIRRRVNYEAYRKREAGYQAKHKLVRKVAIQWKVAYPTARQMIEEGAFPP